MVWEDLGFERKDLEGREFFILEGFGDNEVYGLVEGDVFEFFFLWWEKES